MTRFEYLDALRKALDGLPPDLVERTVADFEKRIVDASAAGQSEDEILAGLPDPQHVADDLHAARAPKLPAVAAAPAQAPRQAAQAQAPTSILRMFSSFIGLMVFNLFLIVPALAYASMLIVAFAVSLACYFGGIVVAGASIAGVNQISLAEPFHHGYVDEPDTVTDLRSHDGHTLVKVSDNGIHVEADNKLIHIEPDANKAAAQAGAASASASASAPDTSKDNTIVDIGPNGILVKDGGKDSSDDDDVDVDMPGIHIHNHDVNVDDRSYTLGTDFISASQPVQIGVGLGLIVAGIVAFLMCLVLARYTWLAIMKLAQLEFGVLRGA